MQVLTGNYFGDGNTGLTGGTSEQDTNTVSKVPANGAPGSESEASAGITPGTPGPVMPASVNTDLMVDFSQHANPPDPYHLNERTPGGGRWTTAPNEATPGRASRPETNRWKKV